MNMNFTYRLLNFGQHLRHDCWPWGVGDGPEKVPEFQGWQYKAVVLFLELACLPGDEFLGWKKLRYPDYQPVQVVLTSRGIDFPAIRCLRSGTLFRTVSASFFCSTFPSSIKQTATPYE